jgi:hypothetical protein
VNVRMQRGNCGTFVRVGTEIENLRRQTFLEFLKEDLVEVRGYIEKYAKICGLMSNE